MLTKALKALFGGSGMPQVPVAAGPEGPMGLSVGLAARLDLMRLLVDRADLAMAPGPEVLVIVAHGVADLGGGGVLHRLYDDDGNMLQIVCNGGTAIQNVSEAMLFKPWDSLTPQSEREWATWDGRGGRVGALRFEADGFAFERHWGDPADEWIEPVEFTETVHSTDGARPIRQKVVSYRRPVGGRGDSETLLLAVESDPRTADRGSVTFMVGYDLHVSEISPV